MRPDPPYVLDPGGRWEAVPAPRWRVEEGRRCRGEAAPGVTACGQPSVAAYDRGRRLSGGGYGENWWAYCPKHMFGRWVEDGQVMDWRRRDG